MTRVTIGQRMLSSALGERTRKELAQSFDIRGLRVMTDGLRLVIDGDCPCYLVKKRAGVLASRVAGSQRVMNRLRVVPHRRYDDGELVRAVRTALSAHEGLSSEGIAVSVHNGVVTLQGSVSSRAASCQAELAAWAVGGVVDLNNRLRVAGRNGRSGPDAASRLTVVDSLAEDPGRALTA
jgi:osmotically-inducible protein OsmY